MLWAATAVRGSSSSRGPPRRCKSEATVDTEWKQAAETQQQQSTTGGRRPESTELAARPLIAFDAWHGMMPGCWHGMAAGCSLSADENLLQSTRFPADCHSAIFWHFPLFHWRSPHRRRGYAHRRCRDAAPPRRGPMIDSLRGR
jgi:hypothetical protein